MKEDVLSSLREFIENEVRSGSMDARKLAAIAVVAAGYGGDMDEELCNDLLDDMDFHYNKVKCRKIEGMLPKLMEMVESETSTMR